MDPINSRLKAAYNQLMGEDAPVPPVGNGGASDSPAIESPTPLPDMHDNVFDTFDAGFTRILHQFSAGGIASAQPRFDTLVEQAAALAAMPHYGIPVQAAPSLSGRSLSSLSDSGDDDPFGTRV